MNEDLRSAFRNQVEARQAFNALGEDATEAQVNEARHKLYEADKKILELLEKPATAPAELRSEIRLSRYVGAIAEERALDGVEAELNQELKLAENMVPLEALEPLVEERADVISPQNAAGNAQLASGAVNVSTGPILSRVFTQTDARFLGVPMPMVPPGKRVYPVMVKGTTAAMQARGSGPDAGGAQFDVVNATPHRLTGRYVFDLEGVAELGGMLESTLRADLRNEMGWQLDNQVVNGSGASGQVSGIIKAVGTDFYPDRGANTDPAQITWETARQLATDELDGKYARTEGDIAMLIGKSNYVRLRNVYRNGATASNVDGVDALRALGTSVRRSFLIPAAKVQQKSGTAGKTSTKATELVIWAAERDVAVIPVWQGITLIRDPYTNAKQAQIVLTAHMLFDFQIRRKDGWKVYLVRPGS